MMNGGVTMEIEYENNLYKLEEASEDKLVFKRKESKYKKMSSEELASLLLDLEEEFNEAEKEASEYQQRIDEFRDCGYNEEDPDFHGMCLHQNGLDDEVERIDNEKFAVKKELDKRISEMVYQDEFIEENGLYDYY